MLVWLNRNAAAIQALGSIASIATTLALVWITARYVSLTQEMARAAREQLRIQQQSAISDTARLLTAVDVFLSTIAEFPEEEKDLARIQHVAVWKRGDVTTLGTLAAAVVGAEIHVRQSIQSLNWLRDKAEQAQQLDGDMSPSAFPWPQWRDELRLARRSLAELRTAARAVQRSMATEDDDSGVKTGTSE